MGAKEHRIVGVVITRNRKKQLNNCLESIMRQKNIKCDILVIDNASEDGTSEFINLMYSKESIIYIRLPENTGSAGGFYTGVREAYLRGYDRIWVMDDDVVPTHETLINLNNADKVLNGNWGYLSSLSKWKDGTLCKANIQKTGIFSFVKTRDLRRDLVPILMASMASLYINAQVIPELGLPIAEYFFYSDDYEYTLRIAKRYPAFLVTNSVIVHNMDNNRKASITWASEDQLWRYAYLFRNDVHLYSRLGLQGNAYLVLKFLFNIVNIIIFADNKAVKIRVLYESFSNGRSFNPKEQSPIDKINLI